MRVCVYIYMCVCVCVCVSSCSVVSDSATSQTVVHQAPLSMGFPRREYWSGLPCPPPGDLPDPGIEPASPALEGGFFTTEPPGEALTPSLLPQNLQKKVWGRVFK